MRVVLVRDVTDLRRRERALLTKDATIREIHHRVKNNLQTVAALLRMQSRRIGSEEARAALDEAVRRVAAIAVVHETLARAPGETVAFDDVADRLVAMAADTAAALDVGGIRREGSFGTLPTDVATPLAMALTELLQNAVEHGLKAGAPDRGDAGTVVLSVARTPGSLVVHVDDDGAGLPARVRRRRARRAGAADRAHPRRGGPVRPAGGGPAARRPGRPGRRPAAVARVIGPGTRPSPAHRGGPGSAVVVRRCASRRGRAAGGA